ncbi:AAA family ATPase [Rhodoplanes sp. TEM]|uniref:AAA family ATPase n=1 Tax=Rhodoplanes tepidamans TaxID=200616 RepID=A0ABT5JGY3_RHOTP|nr:MULTISPECIES: AAA family ATPase [Rhodoplanes]MDC7788983.1 AAA family ATPase [Rhodoplanes tepidamans]MDC7986374.1 AAA family ATPase [Rhodoplanes sp. TEM]MDQ0355696.1 hypothetical protein [Rhodoplanes tepidamans]
MYAESIHIYGFKCFGKAELRLQYPGRTGTGVSELSNINLVLGDNGGGKSSVLRAVAIAILTPALLDSGFVPYRLVRRPRPGQAAVRKSFLKVKAVPEPGELPSAFTGRKSIELIARLETRGRGSLDRLHLESTPDSPITEMLSDDYSTAFFVVGYGATRRVEVGEYSESSARRARGLRYQRIAGLFEDHVALRPLQAWLPRLRERDSRRFREAVDQINGVLPPGIAFDGLFDEDEDQFVFDFGGVPTPFSALSDGYKAFIGWIGDLVGHLSDVVPGASRIGEVAGIVLVDEIDLHLHPEWQRNVVPKIAAAFPKLQFVLTSHSPLVASTVRRENVFVTDTAEDGTATITQLQERVFGRSPEDLLLSSYFGLQTTRPEAFQDDARALFHRAASGDANAALDYLDRLTTPAGSDRRPSGGRRRSK